MNCLECGSGMRVTKTHPSGTDASPTVERINVCACGQRYLTEERIKRRLAISGHIAPVNGPVTTRIRTVNDPPKGQKSPSPPEIPSLSDSDPIRSLSVPLSDLLSEGDQEVDPARVYEPDFLMFWVTIEPIGRRKGDKAKAQDVWRKKGRPNSSNLVAGWIRYRASCGDGFTMDADKWLRESGWSKEWEPAPSRRMNGAARVPSGSQRTIDNVNSWVEENT